MRISETQTLSSEIMNAADHSSRTQHEQGVLILGYDTGYDPVEAPTSTHSVGHERFRAFTTKTSEKHLWINRC